MERCFRCERTKEEVKLIDAIYGKEIVKICERCAITENIPVIRKPTTSQLKEAEKNQTVYQRLKKLSGIAAEEEKKRESILDRIRKLDEQPELERPEEKPLNLIDNFNWHITRARRNKGLGQKQLAWALGESETAIKMLEKGELPEEPEKLIRKLEQFFQIALRKETEGELEAKKRKREERILEMAIEGEPIEEIIEERAKSEEEIKESKKDIEKVEEKEKKKYKEILSFEPEVTKSLTIADLKKIKEEQERMERLLDTEEERKKTLQAENIIRDVAVTDEEKRKIQLKEEIANEMKSIAQGKEKIEKISEKKTMLEKAVEKIIGEKKDYVPTIWELMEKKKEKLKNKEVEEKEKIEEPINISDLLKKEQEESLIGNEIEIAE